jgi:hypothetical protein
VLMMAVEPTEDSMVVKLMFMDPDQFSSWDLLQLSEGN